MHDCVEDVLTEIQVVGDWLRLSLQHHGTYYVPWHHRFFTKPIHDGPAYYIERSIRDLDCRPNPIDHVFNLVQFDGPTEQIGKKIAEKRKGMLRSFLRKQSGRAKEAAEEEKPLAALRKMQRKRKSDKLAGIIKKAENHGDFGIYSNLAYLVLGNYTAHARRRVAQPGSIVRIPQSTVDLIERTNQAELALKELLAETANQTHRWKAAEKALPDHRAGQLIEDLRKDIEAEDNVQVLLQQGQVRSHLARPPPAYVRQPTADEWFDQPAAFFDIEIPRFRTYPEEVTWVGMLHHTPERDQREICTVHNFPLGARRYFHTVRPTVEGVVAYSADFLRPAHRLLAYNAPFDFIKMREAGDFQTGLRDSTPIKETAKEFFTRIGNYGKEVIDLYRWATVALAYLPNKKLDTVMHHLFGESVKDVSYDEMEEIEEMIYHRKPGYIRGANRVYHYLESDVDSLLHIYNHPRFRQSVEDCLWMAETFGCNFSRLFNHQNRINEAQEWEYFKKIGTVRSAVYPISKIREKKEQKARGLFQRLKNKAIPYRVDPGIHDVWQCYIPTAPFFRDIIQKKDRFEDMAKLSQRVESCEDPHRKFYLAKYEDAICRWVIHDYADFLLAQQNFESLHEETTLPILELQRLARVVTEGINYGEDAKLKERLRGGTLSQRQVKDFLFGKEVNKHEASLDLLEQTAPSVASQTDDEDEETEPRGIDLAEYTRIVNSYSLWEHKSNKLGGQFLADGQAMEASLGDRFYTIRQWAQTVDVKHVQGDYVYLREDEIKGAPVIPLMKHKAIITRDRKIYYEAAGVLKGVQEGEEPKDSSNNYEMHYWGRTVRAILADKTENAARIANEALFGLQNKAADFDDLLYFNKSDDAYGVYHTDYTKKVQFWLPNQVRKYRGHFYHEKQKSKVDDLGYHYFQFDKKVIHVMEFDDVSVDWGKYYQRSKKRLENMLEAAQE